MDGKIDIVRKAFRTSGARPDPNQLDKNGLTLLHKAKFLIF